MDKKDKNIVYLLIGVIVLNFMFTGVVYLSLNKKNKETNKILLTILQNGGGEQTKKDVPIISLDIPLYEYLGRKEAPVEVVIATDFQCKYCKILHSEIFPDVIEDYVDKGLIKISYLPYPLEKTHPYAMDAALAGMYLNEVGGFWDYFDYIFQNSDNLSPELIIEYMEKKSIDINAFNKFKSNSANIDYIRDIRAELGSLGITGTPAIIVNDKFYSGAAKYNLFEEYIKTALEEMGRKLTIAEALKIENRILLDVRTAEEYNNGSLDGAVNLDVKKIDDFLKALDGLDKNRGYTVYCKSGTRSTWATAIMVNAGFKDVYNMYEGYDGFKK